MIENTQNRDPLLHLMGMTGSAGVAGYITEMEKAGGAQVAASELMPAEAPWDDLIALGFTKGEPVPGDDLFVNATLPAGWTKKATDHAMHTDILDERGVARVSIGYKAAFYDRWANAHITNVGSQVAMHAIYGDGDVALPETWSVLTEAERSEAISRASEHYDRYAGKSHGEPERARAFMLLANPA
jgi:hypothetical protein